MKLIKITASWCMSCIIMKSRIESLEKKMSNVDIINLDFDNDKSEVEKYNIGTKLPVYLIYNDDIEASRIIGEKSTKELEKFLNEGGLL